MKIIVTISNSSGQLIKHLFISDWSKENGGDHPELTAKEMAARIENALFYMDWSTS